MPSFLLSTRSAVVLDWVGSLLMAGAVWSWLYGIIGPPLNRATLQSNRQKTLTAFAGLMSAWLNKYEERQYDKYRISIWQRARGRFSSSWAF